MTFHLLGKGRVGKFLDEFNLSAGQYRDLVGRNVEILGRKETLDRAVLLEPLYGIKPVTSAGHLARES